MARRLILLVVLAALTSGCGGGREPVRFLVFGEPEELKAFRAVVAAYGEEHPDAARVELVEATERSDLITRLSTSLAAGRPPDVFVMNYRYYGQFASKDAIDPIEDRLARSEAFEPEDFYPEAMDAFRWDGEQLCLPQNVSSLVVYYNRDLFRRAGLADPKPGWTWNELISIAARLTTDAAGNPVDPSDPDQGGGVRPRVYGLGVEPTLIRIAPLVWSNGGELVDDPERPTRLALDAPEARAALDQFFALRNVIPPDVEVEAEDDESRFANGRLAMILSSRRSTPTFRTISEFEWDVAPLPVMREPAGILHSDAYCIAAASERKDEAWRFVEFALSEEGQRITARTGRTVPSLVSVSRENVFLDPSRPPASSEVFLDGVPTIRRVPSISTWPEIEDAAEPILENGLYLGRSSREVARQLDEATRPLFARAEGP